MVPRSSILAWRILWTEGAWRARVHGSQSRIRLSEHSRIYINMSIYYVMCKLFLSFKKSPRLLLYTSFPFVMLRCVCRTSLLTVTSFVQLLSPGEISLFHFSTEKISEFGVHEV